MNQRICIALVLAFAAAAASAEDCSFREPKAAAAKVQALGQETARTNPCTTVPGLTAKSLSAVWAAFISGGKTGGKRFDTPPPPGTPTGKVLATAEGLPFDLRSVAAEGVQLLQVSSKGAPFFTVANPTQAIVFVPVDRLAPGVGYEWQLKTRANAYHGKFELATPQEAADVQGRLAALDQAALSPPVRLLYAAAIYDDADLYTARELTLAKLRSLVGQ